jgi:hypothetical protein
LWSLYGAICVFLWGQSALEGHSVLNATEQFRSRAKNCQREAGTAATAEARQQWLDIADEWERLARNEEQGEGSAAATDAEQAGPDRLRRPRT